MIDDITIARALHVLAVVHWIGGVSFVTLIVLPLARCCGAAGIDLFERIEHGFSRQVRVSIPLAGASGFWMTWRMDLWDRFSEPAFWWMTAIVAVWMLFMTVVFVIEPLLGPPLMQAARLRPQACLTRALRLHILLLLASAVTVLGASAGAHGFFF